MATTVADQGLALPRRSRGWLERQLGTETYRMLRRLVRNPLSVTGFVILVFFVFIAAAAPVLAPPRPNADPYQIPRDGYADEPKAPGTLWKLRQPPLPFWWKPIMGTEQWTHLMGTAPGQYDIWHGIVWGTRTAFLVGIVITFSTAIIGVVIGSISAYYGGIVDMVLMRITDIFMSFPFLLTALTLSIILTPVIGKSIYPAIVALIVFGWMGYARLVRSDILSVREREYVLAARVVGVRDGRILFRHILPNAIFPTLVVASMDMGSYVLSFAGLSFLGVGAETGYADWGQLISFTRNYILGMKTMANPPWYIVFYPGMALLLFVLSWNLVGDALRDVLDPRMRGTRA